MAKYSILTTDKKIIEDMNYINKLLKKGIKTILFSQKDLNEEIKSIANFRDYLDERLLQIFKISKRVSTLTIVDGYIQVGNKEDFENILPQAPDFNYEQFIIEHADSNENIIVEAGAGTGKTTVMVDRIMFLIHTVEGLTLEDISMITFTNDAAYNMKEKIYSTLLKRYKLTKSSKYLKLLEDTSKIRIQTIDSFSSDMISEFGSTLGYANKVKIRGFKYERKQLIYDVLDNFYNDSGNSIQNSLGDRIFELANTIEDFWIKLENIGFTDEEILSIDWGQAKDDESVRLHNTLTNSFIVLNERYNKLKLEKDSIAVSDIVKELRKIVEKGSELVNRSNPIKYLFVDEFQDSDNSQIKTIALLQKFIGLKLFVVGDFKQSIYRFRGADATAFETLQELIEKNTGIEAKLYPLIKNYRTSEDILKKLDPIFRKWARNDLLEYKESLIAQKKLSGYFKSHKSINYENNRKKKAVEVTKEAYEEVKDLYGNSEDSNNKQVVAVLARTNYEVQKLSQWFSEEGIPTYNRQEGAFFSSVAVRDFYSMVKAYLFSYSTTDLFDYINSSYVLGDIDMGELALTKAGSKEQLEILERSLECVGWMENKKAFRLSPVLSVLRLIVDKSKPVENYISKRKEELSKEEKWDKASINEQLTIEAMQYEANIEKLFEILRRSFAGEMASLKGIYDYLKIHIATNRKEEEPDISGDLGSGYVHCMTVHKAKGLEFDTVIIPLTNRQFRRDVETEIIIDQKSQPIKIGWSKVDWNPGTWDEYSRHRCNNYYINFTDKEKLDVEREETRILYVALTRSIRRLEFITIGDEELTWSNLLEG